MTLSIGQKRVMCHIADTMTIGLNSVIREFNQVRLEIQLDRIDQYDRDILSMYDGMVEMIASLSQSIDKIKQSKYNFEQDPAYGKVMFLDFKLGKIKK